MKYRIIKRVNPKDRSIKKFYVQPIRNTTLRHVEIEEILVGRTGLSEKEIRRVMATLVECIHDELLDGNALEINGLGIFSTRIKSVGSDIPDKVTTANIRNVLIKFSADDNLLEDVSNIQFEKVDEETCSFGKRKKYN